MNPVKDRLMARVQVDQQSGCWNWTSSISTRGYAQLNVGKRHVNAHRLSYELHVGPIPKGLVIDHLCRNRLCVNPEHLRVVTNKENLLCGVGASAKNAKKTHCSNGHPLSGENLRVNAKGHRICKECARQRSKARGPAYYGTFKNKMLALKNTLQSQNEFIEAIYSHLGGIQIYGSMREFIELVDARDERIRREAVGNCHWAQDDYGWRTQCGVFWIFNGDGTDGTPEENGALFCHHCGKHLVPVTDDDRAAGIAPHAGEKGEGG